LDSGGIAEAQVLHSVGTQPSHAEYDDFFPPAAARALEAKLRGMSKNVTLTVHAGAGHAFMAPHNASGAFNAALAAQIWPEVVSFLQQTVR
jgi:carboxymethylenebutenolidase